MSDDQVFFSGKDLRDMIIPLFAEQFLVMLVGLADTLIISYAGEAAVSGVSLVNQFNNIFIYIFTALASGGAVVISQYLGRRDPRNTERASGQLLMVSVMVSLVLMALVLVLGNSMLRLLFGNAADDVMRAARIYLRISAYSYPALAVYNVGAAVLRSLGDTRTIMNIAIIANIVNVAGNLAGVFVLQAGVAGVAWPSFIARTLSAVLITLCCLKEKSRIRYRAGHIFTWDAAMVLSILGIAVPNSAENGIGQLVKVALSSIVAMFGTSQIAANGMAQSIWSIAALSGVTMGPVYITVIGRCMGAGRPDTAEYYFRKLNRLALVLSAAWNGLTFILTPLILRVSSLQPETVRLVIILVVIHNIFNTFAFPISGAMSSGLRAAGDVRFTMFVSIGCTLACRLVFSYVFGIALNLGVIGIALAMVLDWSVKAAFMLVRLKSGKWKNFEVIRA